jgi:hypothetical protein
MNESDIYDPIWGWPSALDLPQDISHRALPGLEVNEGKIMRVELWAEMTSILNKEYLRIQALDVVPRRQDELHKIQSEIDSLNELSLEDLIKAKCRSKICRPHAAAIIIDLGITYQNIGALHYLMDQSICTDKQINDALCEIYSAPVPVSSETQLRLDRLEEVKDRRACEEKIRGYPISATLDPNFDDDSEYISTGKATREYFENL